MWSLRVKVRSYRANTRHSLTIVLHAPAGRSCWHLGTSTWMNPEMCDLVLAAYRAMAREMGWSCEIDRRSEPTAVAISGTGGAE